MDQIARLKASFRHKRSRSADLSMKQPLYLHSNNIDEPGKLSDPFVTKSCTISNEVLHQPTPKKTGSFQKLKHEIRKLIKRSSSSKTLTKHGKLTMHDRSHSQEQLMCNDDELVSNGDHDEVFEKIGVTNRKYSHSDTSLDRLQFHADQDQVVQWNINHEKPSLSRHLRKSFRKILESKKSFNKYRGLRSESQDHDCLLSGVNYIIIRKV